MTTGRDATAAPRKTPREKTPPKPLPALRKTKTAALLADAQKAEDIVALDVRGICNFADFFVIASCTSSVHLKATARQIQDGMREKGERPVPGETYDSSSWIVLDFSDVVIHLFHPEARDYYRLESLWADAKKVHWQPAR